MSFMQLIQICSLVVSFHPLLFAPKTSLAQATQTKMPDFERKSSLSMNGTSLVNALHMLQANGQITILADGESILDNVSFNASGVSLREVVDTVTDKFDYKWYVTSGGVVVMTKRFESPQERPQMHLAEMQQMSKDIVKAFSLVPAAEPGIVPHPGLRQLMRSLSPDQYHAITGSQPFFARDLQPDQFQLYTQCLWQAHLTNILPNWNLLSQLLDNFPASYFTADPKLKTISTKIQEDQKIVQTSIDISHIVRDNEGRLHNTRLMQPGIQGEEISHGAGGAITKKEQGISIHPMPKIALTPTTEQKLSAAVNLYGEVSVASLTEALSKQTGLTITAIPALRSRSIIVQARGAHVIDVLTALVEMNDWTLRESESGTLLIARRILLVPQVPTFIPRLIQNAIPRDLRDYFQVPRPSDDRRKYQDPDTFFAPTAAQRAGTDLTGHRVTGYGRHVAEAIRDFRASLVIDNLIDKQLPYSKLTATQEKQILFYYVVKELNSLGTFSHGDLAPCFVNPGNYPIHWDEKSSNFNGPGFGAHLGSLTQK